MPDVWMNIQTTGTVEPKSDEITRTAIITGQSQWDNNGFVILGGSPASLLPLGFSRREDLVQALGSGSP